MLQLLSHSDGLTGVANRRFFSAQLEREFMRLQRLGEPLSLVMMDVDHFKAYNDHYGHLVGDECLSQISQAIQGALHRPGDLLARYGGEEFLVVALDSDLNDVATLGKRLLHDIGGTSIPLPNGGHLKVTASIGAASLSKDDDQDNFIERADGALYAAKQGGRNRLCSCPPAASQAVTKPEYVTVLAEPCLGGAA